MINHLRLSGGLRAVLGKMFVAVIAVMAAGCDLSTGEDVSVASQFNQVRGPVGTVIGLVVDTNGNPVTGAQVTVDGRSQTTTGNGQYRFENVPVVTATPIAGAGAGNAAIPITVIGPTGFMSATFAVGPAAQVTSSNNPNAAGATGAASDGSLAQMVFVDGFSVGVAPVVLPQLNTTVRGTLRDVATGQPLANRALTLDFINVVRDSATPSPGGAAPAVAAAFTANGTIVTVNTGADGSFLFTNVAADSCYRLASADLNITASNNNSAAAAPGACVAVAGAANALVIATTTESANTLNLADTRASIIENRDLTLPYPIDVDGVLDDSVTGATVGAAPCAGAGVVVDTAANEFAGCGQLTSGANQTFTIRLSEATQLPAAPATLSTSDVFVNGGTAVAPTLLPAVVTVVNSSTITVRLDTALGNGVAFNIDLRNDLFRDTAGNVLTVNLVDATAPQGGAGGGCGGAVNCATPPVAYDLPSPNPGYTRLSLRTFNPLDTVVAGATVTQSNVATNVGSANGAQFRTSTTALTDTLGLIAAAPNTPFFCNQGGNPALPTANCAATAFDDAVINQINHDEARVTLTGLVDALNDGVVDGVTGISPAPNGAVDVNTAVFDLTLGAADHYVLWVENVLGGTVVDVNMRAQSITGTDAPRIVGTLAQFGPGVAVPKTFATATAAVGCAVGDATCPLYVLTRGPAASARVFVTSNATTTASNLQPGMRLHVIARTATGFTGNEQTVTLADNVAPTAVPNLLANALRATGSGGGSGTGGGAIIGVSTSAGGLVVLPVDPQSHDVTDTDAALLSDTLNGANEPGALASAALNAAPGSALAFVAPRAALTAGIVGGLGATTTFAMITDATGMAAWQAPALTSRKLGLAVSEPVVVVAGVNPTLTGITTALTGSQALNTFAPEYVLPALPPPVGTTAVATRPFVSFDVANVFTLEANGRTAGARADFSPVLTDLQPNPAHGAVAEVRDYMPPMVSLAFLDNINMVVRFTEPVTATGFLNIVGDCDGVAGLGGLDNISLDLATLFNAGLTPAPNTATFLDAANAPTATPTNTIRIRRASLPAAVSLCFDLPAYAEASYSAASLGTLTALGSNLAAAPSHAGLVYASVPDRAANTNLLPAAITNSWNVWTGLDIDPVTGGQQIAGIGHAYFAMADILGPMIVTSVQRDTSFSSAPAGSAYTPVLVTIRLSHPLFVGDGAGVGRTDANGLDADGADAGTDVSQAELLAYFQGKFTYRVDIGPAANVNDAGADANGDGLADTGLVALAATTMTDVQLLDSNGNSVLLPGADVNSGVSLFLTFDPSNMAVNGGNAGVVRDADDRISLNDVSQPAGALVANNGSMLSSSLDAATSGDPTTANNIRALGDDGDAADDFATANPNAELAPLIPNPAAYTP